MYKNLFSPIKINRLEIRNRIVYPSLGTLLSYDGKPNDRYINFFKEKAKGGAGIVTVGPIGIDELGSGFLLLALKNDDDIPGMTGISSAIQKEGARAWVQLFHAGAYAHPIIINGKKPMAPSPVYSKYSKVTPFEMTIADIHNVQDAYARAAARAQEAGYDGVEILASGGYLITQFLSPLKNQRTDEYGGSFENRIRFPREVIELTRKRVGPDFPLTIRMAGNDFVHGSNSDSNMPDIARIYEKAGVDAISVTGGWHEAYVPQMTPHVPRTAFAYLALNIKKVVSLPIMASNRICSPEDAEKLLNDGFADMVNLGRTLIADSYWPNKAKAGKAEEIRPCVACLQGCMDSIMNGHPVFCVANPCAGYEGERIISKTDNPKKVMIVGAGLAGMEAAVTATLAGHVVSLYDKADDIGGQVWLAGAPPHKSELLEFIRYYRAMLKKHNIDLHLGTKVDERLIKEKSPDHLIIAEGAEPLIPPIKGIDDPSVMTAWEVLRNNPLLGKNVAIIGGGSVGLETALFVASKGTINPETLYFLISNEAEDSDRIKELMFQGISRVTIFEMLPKAGKDVGKSTRWVLMGEIKKFGITIHTNAKVTEINNGTVCYEKDSKEEKMTFDHVIIASGSRSVQNLSAKAAQLGITFTNVGDCIKPGKINDAIHGGFSAAANI